MDSQRQVKHDAERGCLRHGGRNLPKAAIHYVDLPDHRNPQKENLPPKGRQEELNNQLSRFPLAISQDNI